MPLNVILAPTDLTDSEGDSFTPQIATLSNGGCVPPKVFPAFNNLGDRAAGDRTDMKSSRMFGAKDAALRCHLGNKVSSAGPATVSRVPADTERERGPACH